MCGPAFIRIGRRIGYHGTDLNAYLRMLFVQAANVVLMRPHHWPSFSFGDWLARAATRMHRNKLAIALANKLARIAWSVLRHGTPFDAQRDEVMAGV